MYYKYSLSCEIPTFGRLFKISMFFVLIAVEIFVSCFTAKIKTHFLLLLSLQMEMCIYHNYLSNTAKGIYLISLPEKLFYCFS